MTHPPCDRLVVAFELNQRPHPKGRPRFGNGRAYTDDKTVKYEKAVRVACDDAMAGADAHPGPVEVACLFEQKDGRAADLDNLVKAVLDGINGWAFVDDKQVTSIRAHRVIRAKADRVSVAVLRMTP